VVSKTSKQTYGWESGKNKQHCSTNLSRNHLRLFHSEVEGGTAKSSSNDRQCGFSKSERSIGRLALMSASLNHQINFSANWICLDGVWVEVIRPALSTGLPVALNIFRLSKGGAKFA